MTNTTMKAFMLVTATSIALTSLPHTALATESPTQLSPLSQQKHHTLVFALAMKPLVYKVTMVSEPPSNILLVIICTYTNELL